ncbi:DUF2917 domain-containing protein [Chitinimonas taiwanensis]|uniref:DUF2917 domain-containing protein n=1 Tax=Chitinimonas taiwanensis DSM 18899 TaxID=1121279 RepID=A0A1K2HAX7_9NEIS|nr:DUF2917 domain-containing protein [Chitinimonas taiwanensis]SFZ73918.1 Protein of unknown function [Chitinimonas taiwanensis DSM 18899]
MLHQFIEYEQALQRSELRTVRSVDGVIVLCEQGDLWITEDNGGDVLLQRGERHLLRAGRLAVIEALSDARLQLKALAPARGWLAQLRHKLGHAWPRTAKLPQANGCH